MTILQMFGVSNTFNKYTFTGPWVFPKFDQKFEMQKHYPGGFRPQFTHPQSQNLALRNEFHYGFAFLLLESDDHTPSAVHQPGQSGKVDVDPHDSTWSIVPVATVVIDVTIRHRVYNFYPGAFEHIH